MKNLINNYITAVAEEFAVDRETLLVGSLHRDICDIRFAMWGALRIRTRLTFQEIAHAFGYKQQSSVQKGMSIYCYRMENEPEFVELYNRVLRVFVTVRREEDQ